MKQCRYCDRLVPDDVFSCPACGAWDFRPLEKDGPDTSGAAGGGDGAHYEYKTAGRNEYSYSRPVGVSYEESCAHDGRPVSKWLAFILCLFLGVIGAHKFYEGKIFMGIVYMFTGGLFGIGVLVDLIRIACKPDPYYVK